MITIGHPGFLDPVYRRRRNEIARQASVHQAHDTVPDVHYTPDENRLWRDIFFALRPVQQVHACKRYEAAIGRVGIPVNHIPQLSFLNSQLSNTTGFQMSPVAGLVSSLEFLSALRESRMLSTQYIRHHSTPGYTPEPDIVHEVMGHAVMFFDEEYCELTRAFGEAAVNTSPSNLPALERLYRYTIEFGVIREEGELKAFGAGLLSSASEMVKMHNVNHVPLNHQQVFMTPYDTQDMQPTLFVAESFEDLRVRCLQGLDAIRIG